MLTVFTTRRLPSDTSKVASPLYEWAAPSPSVRVKRLSSSWLVRVTSAPVNSSPSSEWLTATSEPVAATVRAPPVISTPFRT